MVGLALALWPLIAPWRLARVNAQMVDGDAKWLKIRGRWHAWFVVLDVATELPVLAALRPSRSPWAWRWLGRQRRLRKKVPQVRITDGVPAYAALVPGATHVWCRLHHPQSITRWLQQPCTAAEEITTRKRVMKKVLQTHDTRTVRRRLARLREHAPTLGRTTWSTQVEAKVPQRICSVGRPRRPSTTTALARFCRAFQRFDATRGGFHSVRSGTRHCCSFSGSMCAPNAPVRAKPRSQ